MSIGCGNLNNGKAKIRPKNDGRGKRLAMKLEVRYIRFIVSKLVTFFCLEQQE